MTRTIDFPHLGIHLSSVGNHITVFGFDIAYYGMIIGAGILAGIFMAVYEAKRTGQKEEDYYDLSICAVIISIIGAIQKKENGCCRRTVAGIISVLRNFFAYGETKGWNTEVLAMSMNYVFILFFYRNFHYYQY